MFKKAAAVAAIALAATVLAPATAAQAKPANCRGIWINQHTIYQTSCWGGTGEFRSYLDCWRNGTYIVRTGAWTPTGRSAWQNRSNASCPAGYVDGVEFAELRG